VASAVAETQPVDALVLEGTATNAQDMVDHRFPWYAKLVARPKFSAEVAAIDPVKALHAYQGPLLVLGGEDDEMRPPSLQRSLYEQAPTPRKAMRLFAGYGHKGLVESPEFPGVLRDFLAAQLGPRRD
jgi:pimeloyl-ACP methyl ester carboxylesterase